MKIFNYIAQRIGHWQHGLGKFKYQSEQEHEKSRKEHEKTGERWCNCPDCRKNSMKNIGENLRTNFENLGSPKGEIINQFLLL